MAKSAKESSGGVDPSANPAGGAADSKVESAAAADRLGMDQADGAVRAEVVTAIDEVDVALHELTAQDKADYLFEEVPAIREFVSEYHAQTERLARELVKDHAMHAKLTRLAHAFAEFRNALGSV